MKTRRCEDWGSERNIMGKEGSNDSNREMDGPLPLKLLLEVPSTPRVLIRPSGYPSI